MKNTLHLINAKLAELSGWLLLVIMILLTADIVSRYFMRPIQGLTTIAVFVMMAVIYLGQARCEEYKEHANIEILMVMLPPKLASINMIIIYFLELIAIGIFFYGMVGNFVYSYQTMEAFADTTVLDIWPSKLAMVVGLFFFELQIIINFIEEVRNFKAGKYINKTLVDNTSTENIM